MRLGGLRLWAPMRRASKLRALLFGVFVLQASSALAQAGVAVLPSAMGSLQICPIASDLPINAAASELLALRDALLRRTDCSNHSDPRIVASFLALQGAVLRRLGDFDQSILVLERALMLDPDRADALLDFALANDAKGNRATAIAIYRQMLAQMDPPLPVKNLLLSRIAVLQVPIAIGVGEGRLQENLEFRPILSLKQSLGFGFGYDHNVNAAISADRLRLTFPDGPIDLPIAESDKRRGAALLLIDHRLQAQWAFPQGDLRWQQRVAQRQPIGLPDVRSMNIEGELSWTPDASGQMARVEDRDSNLLEAWLGLKPRYAVSAQQLDLGGASLLQSIRGQVMASREAKWFAKSSGAEHCLMQSSFDLEEKHYPQRPVLDSLSSLLSIKLLCDGNKSPRQLFFRMGRDWPTDDRPGGMQDRKDLGIAFRFPGFDQPVVEPNSNASKQLQLILSRIDDEKGYNALIENNLTRKMKRAALLFERSQQLGSQWEWVQLAEVYRQHANLALFALKGWSIGLQLKRHW